MALLSEEDTNTNFLNVRLSWVFSLLFFPSIFFNPGIVIAGEGYPIFVTEHSQWLDWFSEKQGKLKLPLHHNEKGEAVASSCADLERLSEEGYYAGTQWAINRFMEFKSGCRMLEILESAKPSHASHLQNFQWTQNIIKALPKELAETFGSLNDAGIHARYEKSRDFLDVFSNYSNGPGSYTLEIQTPTSFQMTYDERIFIRYQVIAFGDFNADGIEDMLLNYAEYHGGSLHLYGHAILTRLAPERDLEIVKNF